MKSQVAGIVGWTLAAWMLLGFLSWAMWQVSEILITEAWEMLTIVVKEFE